MRIRWRGLELPSRVICNRETLTDTFGEFQFSYRYGNVTIPRIDEAEPLKLECEHFVDCIRSGKTPRSDGLSGLRVVSVLEAANVSLKNGGSMTPVARPEI